MFRPTAVTQSPRASATLQILRPRCPVAPNITHTCWVGGRCGDGGSQEAGSWGGGIEGADEDGSGGGGEVSFRDSMVWSYHDEMERHGS